MSMSIAERMAMQARAAAASHQAPMKSASKAPAVSVSQRATKQATVANVSAAKPAGLPPAPKTPSAGMSAAQRMARQGSVAHRDSAARANVPPPPAKKAAPSMSAAERMQKQAVIATEQKRGTAKVEVNNDLLAKLKAEYKEYVKKLMAELDKEGPMLFVPKDEPLKSEPVGEDKVNGISTAEGEMVVEAKPSEPVPGMPFQATPTIVPVANEAPRQSRRVRRRTVTKQA